MLKTCKDALLITQDKNLASLVSEVATQCNIDVEIADEWRENYGVRRDIVLCDSNMADLLNREYDVKTVCILNKGERYIAYRTRFDRYVFDRTNFNELVYAFVKIQKDFRAEVTEISTVSQCIARSGESLFEGRDYLFDFKHDRFLYKGSGIYLTNGEKLTFAKWLLLHKKDNNTRTKVWLLRKKFGKDFMADVNSKGVLI